MNTTTTNHEDALQNLRLKHSAAATQAKALQEKMAPMQVELKKIYDRQSEIEKKIDEIISQSAENSGTVDWSAALSTSPTHGSYKLYQTINDRLPGLYAKGGYWVIKTPEGDQMGQRSVSFMIEKSKPNAVEETLASLNEILPHIQPVDGTKRLGIFEYSLSMHASYTVEIEPDDKTCRIISQSYGRRSEFASFDSLEKLVQQIHDDLYYEVWEPASATLKP